MQKIVLIIVFGFILTIGGCKKCGSQDLGDKTFSLELGGYEKIASLGKKSKPSISITLSIIPHPEADKDMRFKVSSISFVKGSGKLLGRGEEEISAGYEMSPGENMFTYQPNKVGENNIRIEVSDEGDVTKRSAMVSLQVEEKKVPFEMQLTKVKEQGEVIEKEWLFPYQEGKLRLELSAKSAEASKLEYKIKSVKVEKGILLNSAREELKEGDKIELKEYNLVFIPKGEGRAKIEVEIENEESTSKSGIISFEIKPVVFDLSSSLNIVEEGAGEQAEVNIIIPATGNDLDKEAFKVVGVEFSDSLTRKLLSVEGDDLIGSKLRTGSKYTFSWPVQKVQDGVKMKIKLEGAGGVYEKELDFSQMMKQALTKKGKEALEIAKRSRTKTQGILAMKVEERSYEKVISGESEVQKDLTDIVAQISKLEANGLEKSGLDALKKEENELRIQLEKAQEHSKKISEKKFAFNVHLQLERQETFAHIPVALKLSLSSNEPLARKLNYQIKDITVTKGKIYGKIGGEVLIGSKVDFGDTNLKFIPSGEMGEAKVNITIENKKGAEESIEAVIKIKPVEYKVHVRPFDAKKQKEGYGKLDVSIETDKLLEKEKFKVIGWKFKKGNRDMVIEERVGTEDFRIFKENMCLLVAGGREEKKIDAKLEELEEDKEKKEKEKTKAADLLNKFLTQANEHQRKLEGLSGKILALENGIKTTSPGTLAIVKKYDDLEKVKLLGEQSKEAIIEKGRFEAAAFALQEQINRDKKTFDKETKKNLDSQVILLSKKKVWEEMKKVRDKKFSEEVKAELLSESMEKKSSYDLSGKDKNTLYLKIGYASMPSILVLNVEGPSGVAKEVEVDIREGVEAQVSFKVKEVIKNLTELSKEMDQKLNGDSNGQKYNELTKYIDGLEVEIKSALAPLRDSYGEDWWTNPSFMEVKKSKELTEIVSRTMEKLKKLEEMQENSKKAMNSFNLDIDFELPKGERVWAEDYLDMKLELKDVDASMKKKVWKVLSWQCDDKAVVIAGEQGKVLSEVLLSPDVKNKLHVKLPNIGLWYKPNFKIKVGAFDGEELIMNRKSRTNLEPWVKILFEDNVGKFIKKVEDMNKRIEACFRSKNPVDHRFDALANLETEANILKIKHEKVQEDVGGNIKSVAVMLSDEMRKKVIAYDDKEIPKLNENIRLLKQKEVYLKGKSGTVDDLESIDTPDKEGNLLIHRLAGDVKISPNAFDPIVKATKDINLKNKDGYTPLHLAAYFGQKRKAEVLIQAGANLNLQNKYGSTPLYCAAIRGHKEIVELLLAHGSDKEIRDNAGHSLIHRLTYDHKLSTEIFEVLLKSTKDVNIKNEEGSTPLLILMRKRADQWSSCKPVLFGWSEQKEKERKLLKEQMYSDAPVFFKKLELLLKNGANKDVRDKEGQTPLELAFMANSPGSVKTILVAGAKQEVQGIPVLLYAVENERAEMVQAVIDSKKVSVNSGINSTRTFSGIEGKGWSALHVAVARGNEEIVKILLKAGADKDCKYEFWCEWDRSSEWAFLTPDQMCTLARHPELASLF